MSARRPLASLFPDRLLAVLGGAWLGLALVAGGCLNPSPDELPQTDNRPTPTFASPSGGPAGVPSGGSVTATAPASDAPAAPTPELAPAPTPPAPQAAPFDAAAAQPSDAGPDADLPDAG